MKYAFIQDKLVRADNIHRLGVLCRVLDISRKGYYEWQARSRQPDQDTVALETAARAAQTRGRESYGPKRLQTELAEMGYPMSLSAIKRLRARLGLRC